MRVKRSGKIASENRGHVTREFLGAWHLKFYDSMRVLMKCIMVFSKSLL